MPLMTVHSRRCPRQGVAPTMADETCRAGTAVDKVGSCCNHSNEGPHGEQAHRRSPDREHQARGRCARRARTSAWSVDSSARSCAVALRRSTPRDSRLPSRTTPIVRTPRPPPGCRSRSGGAPDGPPPRLDHPRQRRRAARPVPQLRVLGGRHPTARARVEGRLDLRGAARVGLVRSAAVRRRPGCRIRPLCPSGVRRDDRPGRGRHRQRRRGAADDGADPARVRRLRAGPGADPVGGQGPVGPAGQCRRSRPSPRRTATSTPA